MQNFILGIGNLLKGDDGVGVHAALALKKAVSPVDAVVQDIGMSVLDALPAITHAERLIILDAVQTGGQPGTVHWLNLDRNRPMPGLDSVHGAGICQLLASSERRPLEVSVFGIEPLRNEWSTELSPPVAAALPVLINAVKKEVCLYQCAA